MDTITTLEQAQQAAIDYVNRQNTDFGIEPTWRDIARGVNLYSYFLGGYGSHADSQICDMLHGMVDAGRLNRTNGLPSLFSLPPAMPFVRVWDYSEEDMQDAAQPAAGGGGGTEGQTAIFGDGSTRYFHRKLVDFLINPGAVSYPIVKETPFSQSKVLTVYSETTATEVVNALNVAQAEITQLKAELATAQAGIEALKTMLAHWKDRAIAAENKA